MGVFTCCRSTATGVIIYCLIAAKIIVIGSIQEQQWVCSRDGSDERAAEIAATAVFTCRWVAIKGVLVYSLISVTSIVFNSSSGVVGHVAEKAAAGM